MSAKSRKCIICDSEDLEILIEINNVPVFCNILCKTKEEALNVAKDNIVLAFCLNCGHAFNLSFDPGKMDYSPNYENALHYSRHFREYAQALARRLVETYDLHNKNIIEIGSGDGTFLNLVCHLGNNRGIGFDPGYRAGNNPGKHANITIIQDTYSEKYAAAYQADLICCRHVLEHIYGPRDFVGSLRNTIARDGTVVYFEVPNFMYTLKDSGIWDLIYEHCSYFSIYSISHLFHQHGFDISNLHETYQKQFLSLDARVNIEQVLSGKKKIPEEIYDLADQFSNYYHGALAKWKAFFQQNLFNEKGMVVWGGGSKGVTFLNTLGLQDEISAVVDMNPRKQGMFVAGTGHHIISPQQLTEYQPEFIIIMNSIYQHEIEKIINDLDIHTRIVYANNHVLKLEAK